VDVLGIIAAVMWLAYRREHRTTTPPREQLPSSVPAQ
jgi:hypothetical protein